MNRTNLEDFKKQHGYFVDGIWYPRVTSIVQIKNKPALFYFYAKAQNYAEANRMKLAAANEGKIVHEILEAIVSGKEPRVLEKYIGFKLGFEKFLSSHSFLARKEWIERRVKHSSHRYSGTFDLLAEIDGVFSLLDIKTASAIYDDYRLQTSAYLYALNDEPWLSDSNGGRYVLPKEVEKRYILRVNQKQVCEKCGAVKKLRDMGDKIENNKNNCQHQFSPIQEDWELKEFDKPETDFQAFLHCKGLWEWDNRQALEELGYL